jgi:type I restriction enzyme, S subunit
MNNLNTASNWPEIPIGKTGQVLGGRQRSPHATGSPQKYLRVANVFDGYIDSSDVFEMPFSEEESKRFLLAPGDILLNEGQSLELVGRSAIYRGDPPDCCFQNTLIRYRANSDVLPEFAQYTFQNFLRLGTFAAIASQTTSIAHLGTGRFAALPMPVPPLDEQRAIASALSDMDALLAKLDQLIAKKRDIKQAAMQELLTGRRKLPGHGNIQWRAIRLGDVLAVRHGKSQHEVVKSGGEYPILASGGEIGRTDHWLYNKPSVLIGRKGTIDNPLYVDRPFWTIDTLFYTEIDTTIAVEKYIYYVFKLIDWRSYNEASGVPSLSSSTISNINFKCPPREEQAEIAALLTDMDTEITALEARREKTRLIKQGMMQELLSGRVRLI